MYVFPEPHKCPKCFHEMKYGPHEGYNKSPITEDGNPICPKCWNNFLKTIGSEMLCTVNFLGQSDFDKAFSEK